MTTSRDYHTATLLPNGTVLIAGGNDLEGDILSSAEIYDPATATWTTTGSMTTARSAHTATLLLDGTVLVTGGCTYGACVYMATSSEIYNPATGTWSVTGSLTIPRNLHTATLLPNGTVLVAGGNGPVDSSAGISAEIYDPVSGTWQVTGNLTTPRQSHTANLLSIGTVLAAGRAGQGPPDNFNLASAELYDVAAPY